MKIKPLFLLILLTISVSSFSQTWLKFQLDEANTAKDISYLTKNEKETIMYINLCRLFPIEFLELEVNQYQIGEEYGDSVLMEFKEFKRSLQNDLLTRTPSKPLKFERALFLDAKCYSTEISKADRNPHERIDCKKNDYAECVSFGEETGKDIALQLLIDAGIKSLGHREICLSESYSEIGVSCNSHFEFKFCAVLEFQ
ncbi:MAG: hypothetical protein ABIO82_03100 [Ginsengibacter sp.]